MKRKPKTPPGAEGNPEGGESPTNRDERTLDAVVRDILGEDAFDDTRTVRDWFRDLLGEDAFDEWEAALPELEEQAKAYAQEYARQFERHQRGEGWLPLGLPGPDGQPVLVYVGDERFDGSRSGPVLRKWLISGQAPPEVNPPLLNTALLLKDIGHPPEYWEDLRGGITAAAKVCGPIPEFVDISTPHPAPETFAEIEEYLSHLAGVVRNALAAIELAGHFWDWERLQVKFPTEKRRKLSHSVLVAALLDVWIEEHGHHRNDRDLHEWLRGELRPFFDDKWLSHDKLRHAVRRAIEDRADVSS